ncbi:MAG TPA: peptidylprolyl isomerase [Pirellulaceae bacterium]|nr:peptidylprolyl isomerase [Pirellulaceae bacterium]HMO90761.1 peptidylprolyl isomerase [Pirellulaceae bacterium]HMP68012.1 peptidylprolyl isomerase [Pirellulaceae bacterium]
MTKINSRIRRTERISQAESSNPVSRVGVDNHRLCRIPRLSFVVFGVCLLSLSTATGQDRLAQAPQANNESSRVEMFELGRTLAIVGGHPIFVSDMSLEINQILDRYLATAPETVRREQRENLIERLLPKYIEAKMLYIDVLAGLPAEADVDAIFESAGEQFDENVLPLIKKQAGIQSTSELDAQLRSQGSSLRLMRKSWSENELVKYIMREKVTAQSEVTREELLEYYRNNQAEFERKARARWEQVMVRFDRFNNKQEARNELAKLGNKIINGASLSAVAKNESHDINADKGGQYDWTVKGSLVSPELDREIFSLPLNELSEIIESKSGYHIIRVLERQEAGLVPFLEVQSEIKNKITEDRREAAFQSHLEKLRERIPVDILIEVHTDIFKR